MAPNTLDETALVSSMQDPAIVAFRPGRVNIVDAAIEGVAHEPHGRTDAHMLCAAAALHRQAHRAKAQRRPAVAMPGGQGYGAGRGGTSWKAMGELRESCRPCILCVRLVQYPGQSGAPVAHTQGDMEQLPCLEPAIQLIRRPA